MDTPNSNTPNKRVRRIMLLVILTFVVITALIFGANEYIYALHHETTDDAQIDADIAPVSPHITGYVDSIFFVDNQKVTKGQLLVRLDDRDLQIKVIQAKAVLDNAEATVTVTKVNVLVFEANFQTALSNLEAAKVKVWKASQDYDRYQSLLKDKATTQQQFDIAKADKENTEALLKAAQKQVDAAKAQLSAAEAQVAASQSIVSQRQADLNFSKLQLSYAAITAPFSGTVSKKSIELGQLVQAGQSLFAVVPDSEVYVTANFKETQLEDMKVGQRVKIDVDAYPDEEVEGKIFSFSAASGAKFSLLPPDNATGNFVKVVQRIPVKIILNVPASLKDKLRPGMSVKVAVDTD